MPDYFYKKIFVLCCVFGAAFFLYAQGSLDRNIIISNAEQIIATDNKSYLPCDPTIRPIAVMISSDPEARPLSGLSDAEIIFEMPVTDNGITRIMAVYRCTLPQEVGSIRSSRIDFIPLAQGLGAIYAHWGGEHKALETLNSGIIDNIDGLKYDGTVYYRKKINPPPHNGFTNAERLKQIIVTKNYTATTSIEPYEYDVIDKSEGIIEPSIIYEENFAVSWHYDIETNTYTRTRDDQPEIDFNNNEQVKAKNIVIMRTGWSPINRDYIRVNTIGSGTAIIYKNGISIEGQWKKETNSSKLIFYDNQGKEVSFANGLIWIEITIK